MRSLTRTLLAGLVLAGLAVGCGPAPSEKAGDPNDPNAPQVNPGLKDNKDKKGPPTPPPPPPPPP
jgi:hypothetical protein